MSHIIFGRQKTKLCLKDKQNNDMELSEENNCDDIVGNTKHKHNKAWPISCFRDLKGSL